MVMLFGLTCCSSGGKDTSGEEQEKTDIAEDPIEDEEPEKTEEKPKGDLVVDAHTYAYSGKDEFDQDLELEYHIPKIDLDTDGAKAINDEIEKTFFGGENEMAYIGFILNNDEPKNSEVGYGEIDYDWYVNQDILSLVIECEGFYDNDEYYVYNLDMKSDTRLANADMIATAGLTESDFKKTAEKVLGSKYWEMFGGSVKNIVYDESSAEFFNKQLSSTISGDNINNADLYLNEKSQLCMIAQIYSLAGADYYWHDLNTVDYTLLPYKLLDVKEYAEKPKATPAYWKSAYTDYINDGRSGMDGSFGYESYGFYLVDINGDEIPELYIDYLTTAGGSELVTYANGEVVSQYLTVDSLSFIKGKNIFREAGGRMGTYFDIIYTIKNGKFTTVAEGGYMVKNWEPYEADYTWDDATVTADEYDSLMNSVFDTDSAIWAMDTTRYDNQSIITAIQNY
jgi:hypothetical protein